MKSGYVKIIECFNIPSRGLITALQHQENGIPPTTRLMDSKKRDSWIVQKRVLSGILLINDSEIYFDCETTFEHINHSFKTEKARQKAIKEELERRKKGVYWYFLIPDPKNQQIKPEPNSLLKIIKH